jgi:hypothetical protein
MELCFTKTYLMIIYRNSLMIPIREERQLQFSRVWSKK